MQWATAVTARPPFILWFTACRVLPVYCFFGAPQWSSQDGRIVVNFHFVSERITDWELELKPRPYSRMYVLSTMPESPAGHGYSWHCLNTFFCCWFVFFVGMNNWLEGLLIFFWLVTFFLEFVDIITTKQCLHTLGSSPRTWARTNQSLSWRKSLGSE